MFVKGVPGLYQMHDNLHTTFSTSFSWKSLNYDWLLIQVCSRRSSWKKIQHWFRKDNVPPEQATSICINHWWHSWSTRMRFTRSQWIVRNFEDDYCFLPWKSTAQELLESIETLCRLCAELDWSSLVQVKACRLFNAKPSGLKGAYFSDILPDILMFALKKIELKMSGKCWPFRLGLNFPVYLGFIKSINPLRPCDDI